MNNELNRSDGLLVLSALAVMLYFQDQAGTALIVIGLTAIPIKAAIYVFHWWRS